jgi:AcrR family transcriptional regulator
LQTREDILRAAARAFARRGLEATTMQEIAAEAGYTVPSLYAYFDGKQKIVDALVAFLAQGVLGPLGDTPPAGLTFAQRLELVLRRQLEFAEHLGEGVTVFFALKPDSPAARTVPAGKTRTAGTDLFIRNLTKWLKDNAEAQDIGGRRPEDVAYLLKAIMHATFLQWVHAGVKGGLADRAVLIVDLLLHGVAARPPAEAAVKP